MRSRPSTGRSSETDLSEAITLAARLMFIDAKPIRKFDYLRRVLPDQADVDDALAFIERKSGRSMTDNCDHTGE